MKVARYYGLRNIRFEEIPRPSYGENDVLIKVIFAGICGSDLHIYNKGMFIQNIPETMGHEFVGIVEKIGRNVTKYKIGDAVTANPMVPCMQCNSCKKGMYNTCEKLGFIGEVAQGCYAQYLVMPEQKVIPVPVDDVMAAEDLRKYVLTEPLAVAVNVLRRAGFERQDSIAVLGAGPIGCLVIALAKQIFGVKNITAVDISEERLVFAKRAGADVVLTDGTKLAYDYDGIIDCAGVPQTIQMALEHVDTDGEICIVSIFENPTALDCNRIVEKQIRITGCNVYTEDDLYTACSILKREDFDIEFLITHTFLLEECKEAFALLANGKRTAQKVIFQTNDI